ncbi:MAG: CRISPR-associated endonuclease Cas4g/Cas1g [Bacillota bacterium]|jgi:CRISPR-associated protein Cas1|nr:CRISPR-associated endonuclease Cas1 [Syntrophomonadaceae bacterium]
MSQELLIPVSAVAELLYCPRNFYYRVLEGAEETNKHVTQGKVEEERRDAYARLARPEYTQYRRIHLTSEKLGLSGILDVVEERAGEIYPVEFKTGTTKDKLNDAVQLCCQALLLEEHLGTHLEKGYIHYTGSQRRKVIWFDQQLRDTAYSAIENAKRIILSNEIPAPVADARCNGCSLASRCLHEEVSSLHGESKPRRPLPGINLGRTLYVDTPGAYLRKRGERVVVTKEKEILADVPLTDIDQVVVANGVNASVSLLNSLLYKGVPAYFITGAGRVMGWLNPCWNRNILLRQDQFRLAQDQEWRLRTAKGFVTGKVANMRTILMRYARSISHPMLEESIKQISAIVPKIAEADSIDTLRGYEGNASRSYFQSFGTLFKEKADFNFEHRNRRPPKDPVNALLSYGYAMLTKDVASGLMLAGLDPYLGIYHVAHYGRPALALDLMEEFRCIIVDSVVLRTINSGMIGSDEFEDCFGGIQLTESGRKKFFTAYQQRMSQEIIHPIFDYNLPYRRIIELQARFLAKVMRGELEEYKAFMVR